MAKVKVKDIKGIVTNYDENDLSLESLSSSTNFKFENNWAEIESPNVELDIANIELETGYIYEDGIITILSSDTLSESDTSFQKEVTFLVAKKVEDGTTYRKFYIKVDSVWTDTADIAGWITENMIATDKEGDVFFATEEGRLKIYLPHTAYWLGYIDRKLSLPGLKEVNELYFDKLIEKFNFNIKNATSGPLLAESYRTGVYNTTIEYTAADDIDGDAVTWEKFGEITDPSTPSQIEIKIRMFKLKNDFTGEYIQTIGEIPSWLKNETDEPVELMWLFVIDPSDSSKVIVDTEAFFRALKYTGSGGISYTEDRMNLVSFLTPYNNEWEYIANLNTKADGIGFNTTQYETITTLVLDERSELIVNYTKKEDLDLSDYGIKITSEFPTDINKRVTRVAYYIRFDNVSDFELFEEFDLQNTKKPFTSAYATNGTLTGVFLSSRLGITIDPSKEDYDIVQGIKTRTLEAGYAVAIAYNNPAYIQYNAIGGGKIMSDIFYYEAELDIDNTLDTRALVGANGKIFIISESSTKVLNIESSSGQPIFALIDTLEFGVKSSKDALEVQGGIIINTSEGIFLTNGYDREWVSEQINNVCIDNYDTSLVYYNKQRHELYYFPDNSSVIYYIFSFRRRKWEKRRVENLVNLKSLLQTSDGKISYLSDYYYTWTWTEEISKLYGSAPIEGDGSGTISDPYVIRDLDDFLTIEGSSDHFILANDIDFTDATFGPHGWGTVIAQFNGTLNGNGFTIYDLTLSGSLLSNSGLFNDINSAISISTGIPAISNLHIDNFSITQGAILTAVSRKYGVLTANVSYATGAGLNHTVIENVKMTNSTLDIRAGTWKERCSFGMIAASNGLFSDSGGDITNCIVDNTNILQVDTIRYAEGHVDNNFIGGIAGRIGDNASINKCMSGVTLDVNSNGFFIDLTIGGLVYQGPAINSCYTGTINNANDGDNIPPMGKGDVKEYTYSVPIFLNCTSTKYAHSFVAGSPTGYSTSYVNIDSGFTQTQEADINAKTSAEMRLESTYVGWDFDDIWGIDPSINDGFPYIRAIEEAVWGADSTVVKETITHTETSTKQGYFIPTNELQDFTADMTSSLSNLDAEDIEKRLDFIDIDYEGIGNFYLYDEVGTLIQDYALNGVSELSDTLKRHTERLYIKLDNRIPIEKMKYKLSTTDNDFKLYNITINFSTEEKDGGFDAIPKNQAPAERIDRTRETYDIVSET